MFMYYINHQSSNASSSSSLTFESVTTSYGVTIQMEAW